LDFGLRENERGDESGPRLWNWKGRFTLAVGFDLETLPLFEVALLLMRFDDVVG
jgi:hypothetical protein